MSNERLLRTAKLLLAILAGGLLIAPSPAAADSVDIVTLDFTGSGSCLIGSCGSGTTVTGTYSFDPDASSIVGPWSFSTPFGTSSSSDSGASSHVFESETVSGFPTGIDFLSFVAGNEIVQLAFNDPMDYEGSIVTQVSASGITFFPSLALSGNNLFSLASGDASPVATPEPSSLVLLAIGLLGVGLVRRCVAEA